MKVLLDTVTLLWHYRGDPRTSALARSVIEDEANDKFISPASFWEIAIKISSRKLTLVEPISVFVQNAVDENGFVILPILPNHADFVASLPFHHEDPFDRMIVAQAKVEGMKLVSPDALLDLYGVDRIW